MKMLNRKESLYFSSCHEEVLENGGKATVVLTSAPQPGRVKEVDHNKTKTIL
jgi:hypothetical protein